MLNIISNHPCATSKIHNEQITMTSSSQRKGGAIIHFHQQISLVVALFFLTYHAFKNVEWLSTLSEKQQRTQQVADLTIVPPYTSRSTSSRSKSPSRNGMVLSTNTTFPKVNVEAQLPALFSAPQIPPTSQLPNHHGVNLTKEHVTTAMMETTTTTDKMINKSATKIASSSLPLCTRQQIQTGAWNQLTLDKPPYVSRYKHLRCYPDEVYNTTPWTHSWDWQPSDKSCTLATWNSTEFCDLLPHVTVSIIGDSLSWEQYTSLLQLLGQRKFRQSDQHKSKKENRNIIQTACNGKTSIIFRNDPRLEHITESIQSNFPLVMILNRGAHYVNDSTLLTDIQHNVQELQTWKETCRKTNLHCHLFWRTTVPGHPLCVQRNETIPINNLTIMEERLQNLNNYDNVTIDYHWYDFQHQNELILRELATIFSEKQTTTLSTTSNSSSSVSSPAVSYQVIDAYHLNMLRPDEHRIHTHDCLHNCYPGKMDVLNQILLHYLKMDRTSHDVQRLEYLFQMIQAKQQQQEEQE